MNCKIEEFKTHFKSIEEIIKNSDNNENLKREFDNLLIDTNKIKYEDTQRLIKYITDTKIPNSINKKQITLFALLNYFQKKYVFKNFLLYLQHESFQQKAPWDKVKIVNKLSNFPHLIGVKGERNLDGNIISKSKPRKFLDGVLYQWILMNNLEDFVLDFEKLETLPWIWQTLVMPTYILPKEAIKKENTKFNADLIFVKRIFNSSKYSFHLVGLKHEDGNNFTLTSHFPITKERFHRIKSMFDLDKAYYDFYKSNKKAPISSGSARSI